MNANAGYIMLIGIMLVPIVWLAWIEPGVRYALVCLAILGRSYLAGDTRSQKHSPNADARNL